MKTCDLPNAGTDAAAYLKIFYEAGHDSETFQLDNPDKSGERRLIFDKLSLTETISNELLEITSRYSSNSQT